MSYNDYWGLEKICLEGKKDKFNPLFVFNPYKKENDQIILKIEETKKNAIILLRNGSLISLPFHVKTKYLANEEPEHQIPRVLNVQTKIINISCGLEHTLAKGRDYNVYSWGSNSKGQLGLSLPILPDTIVEDPTLIKFEDSSSRPKIEQIYAREYSSFCISEKNVLYFFGKIGDSKGVGKPVEIKNIKLIKEKTYAFFSNYDCSSFFFCDINLPDKTNIEDTEGVNSELNEIKKYKEEITKLQNEINNNSKKVCITTDDYQNLKKKVKVLKSKYNEKIKHDNKDTQNQSSIEEMNTHKHDNQIEYFLSKKNYFNNTNYLDKYFSCLDGRTISKMKKDSKKVKLINKNKENDKEQNSEINKKDNNENSVYIFSNNIPQITTLIDRVGNEVQIEKFKYLEESHKKVDKSKADESYNKKINEYIEAFDSINDLIQDKIDSINDKSAFPESENIKEKCTDEYRNFLQNTLKIITTSNLDMKKDSYTSLTEMVDSSMDNLDKLNKKVNNIKYNNRSKNETSKNIIELFRQNIFIGQQNNGLVKFMLNKLINNVYGKTLEKGENYDIIEGYSQKKNEVDQNKRKTNLTDNVDNSTVKQSLEEMNNGDKYSNKSKVINNVTGHNPKKESGLNDSKSSKGSKLSINKNSIKNNDRFSNPQDDKNSEFSQRNIQRNDNLNISKTSERSKRSNRSKMESESQYERKNNNKSGSYLSYKSEKKVNDDDDELPDDDSDFYQ